MAIGAAFKSGFDSFIDSFDRAQTQEVALAQAVQAARMQVAQENRFRAGLNVQAQLQQSQEQRMLENQAFANFRNKLQAPVDVQLAANNMDIQRQSAREFSLLADASQARAGTNRRRALIENAIALSDADMLSNLTGVKFKRDSATNKLVYTDPNGRERDFRGSLLEVTILKENNALLEQQAITGHFKDLIYGGTSPTQTNTPVNPLQQDQSWTTMENKKFRGTIPAQSPAQAATPMPDYRKQSRVIDNLLAPTGSTQPNSGADSSAVDAARAALEAIMAEGSPKLNQGGQARRDYAVRVEQARKALKDAQQAYESANYRTGSF